MQEKGKFERFRREGGYGLYRRFTKTTYCRDKYCVFPLFKKQPINEGVTKTYPSRKVEKLIRKSVISKGVEGVRFFRWDDKKEIAGHIIVTFYDGYDDTNSELELRRIMTQCGYHFATTFVEEINGERLRCYQFEPLYQNNKSLNLKSKFLYHLTTVNNFEKIKKYGFCPKFQCVKDSSYPSRVYFFSVYDQDLFTDYILQSEKKNKTFNKETKELNSESKFIVIQIDITRLDIKKVQFFSDPNFDGIGVFTYNNIPSNTITGYQFITIE